MDERLVSGEKSVTSREQITFEPAFKCMLRKQFHDPAVGRQFAAVGIFGKVIGQPQFLAGFINGIQLVGSGFVGTEDAEALHVVAHDVPQEASQGPRVLGRCLPWRIHLDRIVPKIGETEGLAEQPAVRMGIGAHAPVAFGREGFEFRD